MKPEYVDRDGKVWTAEDVRVERAAAQEEYDIAIRERRQQMISAKEFAESKARLERAKGMAACVGLPR